MYAISWMIAIGEGLAEGGMAPRYLGEFEPMVLLANLRFKDEALALSILAGLEEGPGHRDRKGDPRISGVAVKGRSPVAAPDSYRKSR